MKNLQCGASDPKWEQLIPWCPCEQDVTRLRQLDSEGKDLAVSSCMPTRFIKAIYTWSLGIGGQYFPKCNLVDQKNKIANIISANISSEQSVGWMRKTSGSGQNFGKCQVYPHRHRLHVGGSGPRTSSIHYAKQADLKMHAKRRGLQCLSNIMTTRPVGLTFWAIVSLWGNADHTLPCHIFLSQYMRTSL